MPLLQVTATKDTLERNRQDELISRLSDAVLKAETADPNDPAAQALVWAHYNEIPQGASYVGGENLDVAPLRIAVTTPEGALSDGARKSLAEDIGTIVDDLVGPYEGRLNHWLMLHEIAEGSWGGAGQIFPLAGIQAAMNIKAA